jgi:hypothetical protein
VVRRESSGSRRTPCAGLFDLVARHRPDWFGAARYDGLVQHTNDVETPVRALRHCWTAVMQWQIVEQVSGGPP